MKQELRDIEFNFIELKKFNKSEEELESIIEKWIYFIKNADNLSMIPKTAEKIPELNEAYKLASMNAWTEEELEIYEYWQIRDAGDRYKIQEEFEKGMENGMEKGMEKAMEKGMEKGMEKAMEKVALEMIKDGESNNKIVKYTGLSDALISELRSKLPLL
jgi:predicted transposase/invertase (TIGR01784 family)